MALEEITTDVDIQTPFKKKLGSMKKKKYVKGVEVMDTELRSNVPVKQVQKEDQDFINAMTTAKKMDAEEIKAKAASKLKMLKKQ